MSLPARLRAFGISKALDYLERDPDANLPKTGVQLPEQSHALVHSKGPDKESYLPSL